MGQLIGFARLSPEKRLELARKGGAAVPASKRYFSKNKEFAAEMGKKGGANVKAENRTFSRDKKLAAEAGRKGGKNNRGRKKKVIQ